MSYVSERGALATAPKTEGTTIKYNGGVTNASGANGSIMSKPNFVQNYQRIYQEGKFPVHLKTPRDRLISTAILFGSVASLAFSAAALMKLSMPKKN